MRTYICCLTRIVRFPLKVPCTNRLVTGNVLIMLGFNCASKSCCQVHVVLLPLSKIDSIFLLSIYVNIRGQHWFELSVPSAFGSHPSMSYTRSSTSSSCSRPTVGPMLGKPHCRFPTFDLAAHSRHELTNHHTCRLSHSYLRVRRSKP